jgi:hypothetical protein
MTTSFRKPFTVIRRNIGYWSNGVYIVDDAAGQELIIMATVQEPSTGDMNKIAMTPYGGRVSGYIKIYTDTRLQCVNQAIEGFHGAYPGDIFLFDNSQYLLFGESNFQHLRSSVVSHWRYWACELIEGYKMENVA